MERTQIIFYVFNSFIYLYIRLQLCKSRTISFNTTDSNAKLTSVLGVFLFFYKYSVMNYFLLNITDPVKESVVQYY